MEELWDELLEKIVDRGAYSHQTTFRREADKKESFSYIFI
ncbi:hypothetical protein MGA3_00010 [Bacillus methanolicus MGA3]|nr:hypothetical protein MGA3_00010 [Bacillus methanolicus MGA3]